MKKLIVLAVLFFSVAAYQRTDAQLRVNVNLNIGNQPDWGPTGYDYVDYYYLPDMDVYYNVPQHLFIYPEGSRWIYARSLPPRYGGYNLYNSYKVVVNKPRPYLHPDVYRREYGRYKGGRGPSQVIIRDSHDEKYKNHYNNGNGNGHGNSNGHGNNGHGKDKNNGHGNDKNNGHGNNGNGGGNDKGNGHGNGKGKGHNDH
jgi:hypothetical protein